MTTATYGLEFDFGYFIVAVFQSWLVEKLVRRLGHCVSVIGPFAWLPFMIPYNTNTDSLLGQNAQKLVEVLATGETRRLGRQLADDLPCDVHFLLSVEVVSVKRTETDPA